VVKSDLEFVPCLAPEAMRLARLVVGLTSSSALGLMVESDGVIFYIGRHMPAGSSEPSERLLQG